MTININKSLEMQRYQGKKVLVTGHTGFKGSWLSIWLKSLGADVIGYSLKPNTKPSIFNNAGLADIMTSIIGDIRHNDHLDEVFKDYKPEIVFHLAAQPIVRDSYDDPKYTYETNVLGVVNVLEAVRKSESVKTVVNVTSDKCYENKELIRGYTEDDRLGGSDPYSSSKACSELVTSAYRESFFSSKSVSQRKVAVATARAGNVVGGGDWAKDRIVPDSIKAIVEGVPIRIRNPQAIRPWQHVLEPLSGYLWLGLLLNNYGAEYSSAWNFCPKKGQAITVKELVNVIIQIWGKGSFEEVKTNIPQPKETHYLSLDCSKAFNQLHWEGLLEIKDTVLKTVNWYKDYYSHDTDVLKLCKDQINDYISIARQKQIAWASSLVINS